MPKIKEDKPALPVAVKVQEAAPTDPVYGNSTLLDWPTDHWALCKDLKKAMVQIASRLNGHPDKKALFEKVLDVGLKHIEAKFAEQSANNAAMRESNGA